MQFRTLYSEGNFYKGNLHTHTTMSDGQGTPEQVVAYYRDVRKLDFLALTDHGLYKEHRDLSTDNFLMLPGVELNTLPNEQDRADHHVVGIGVEGETDLADGTRFDAAFAGSHDCQGLIDTLNGHGLIPIFCHPNWSQTTLEEGTKLRNVCGMEIMNFACEGECHNGASDPYYEAALLAGNKMWCFATDDSHRLSENDCGAFIGVRCASLTNRDITKAIRDGSFYASMGPEIYDFYVEDGKAHLRCSEAKQVFFMAQCTLASNWSTKDKPLTGLDAELPDIRWRVWSDSPDPFVRAVVVDFEGRVAWTQPISYGKRK